MSVDRICSQSNRPRVVVVEYGKRGNRDTEAEDVAVVVAVVKCMNYPISGLSETSRAVGLGHKGEQ